MLTSCLLVVCCSCPCLQKQRPEYWESYPLVHNLTPTGVLPKANPRVSLPEVSTGSEQQMLLEVKVL